MGKEQVLMPARLSILSSQDYLLGRVVSEAVAAWFDSMCIMDNFRSKICAICLQVLCIGSACSLLAECLFAQQTLWSGDDDVQFVRLVKNTTKSVNRHPASIAPKILEKAFLAIRIATWQKPSRASEKDPSHYLFPEEIAALLSRYTTLGLREASPRQDVVFRLRGNLPLLGNFILEESVTTGRIFWDGKYLNIIFGAIHKPLIKRFLLGQDSGYVGLPDPGSRRSSSSLDWRILLRKGIMYGTGGGKKHYDWIRMDLRALQKNEQVSKPKRRRSSRPFRSTVDDNSVRPRTVLTLDAKLEKLKELHKKGLISREMYRERTQQLLEDEL